MSPAPSNESNSQFEITKFPEANRLCFSDGVSMDCITTKNAEDSFSINPETGHLVVHVVVPDSMGVEIFDDSFPDMPSVQTFRGGNFVGNDLITQLDLTSNRSGYQENSNHLAISVELSEQDGFVSIESANVSVVNVHKRLHHNQVNDYLSGKNTGSLGSLKAAEITDKAAQVARFLRAEHGVKTDGLHASTIVNDIMTATNAFIFQSLPKKTQEEVSVKNLKKKFFLRTVLKNLDSLDFSIDLEKRRADSEERKSNHALFDISDMDLLLKNCPFIYTAIVNLSRNDSTPHELITSELELARIFLEKVEEDQDFAHTTKKTLNEVFGGDVKIRLRRLSSAEIEKRELSQFKEDKRPIDYMWGQVEVNNTTYCTKFLYSSSSKTEATRAAIGAIWRDLIEGKLIWSIRPKATYQLDQD